MNLLYFKKKYKLSSSALKLLLFILCFPLLSCFNNKNIEGERLDLYQQEMETYLTNNDKNIELSPQKSIKSQQQVENGPTHLLEHSKFETPLTKLWETRIKIRGSISAPIFSSKNIYIELIVFFGLIKLVFKRFNR